MAGGTTVGKMGSRRMCCSQGSGRCLVARGEQTSRIKFERRDSRAVNDTTNKPVCFTHS